MNKILVDTTVWIDALNGVINKQTALLEQLIEEDAYLVLCPTVIQELLQGIRDDRDYYRVKEALSGFEILEIDPLEAAYGSASLYRNLRKKGVTINKSNDCLIAYFSIFHNARLLHRDRDFNLIAKHSSLLVLGQ